MTTTLPAPSSRTTARWPVWLLRAAVTAVTVLVLAQAALAGSFLSGMYEALAAHARNAGIMAACLVLQLIAAVLCRRMRLATRQPVVASVAQCVVVAALIPLGEQRILAVHVPLAVLLVVGVLQVAYVAWRRIPAGPEAVR
ncbi:hypothetical protein ACWGH8_32475 [Nonomuraea muscovyensis]